MSIKSYEDLQVWQLAVDLVVECRRVIEGFPRDERFGLTSQVRSADVDGPTSAGPDPICGGAGRSPAKALSRGNSFRQTVNEIDEITQNSKG